MSVSVNACPCEWRVKVWKHWEKLIAPPSINWCNDKAMCRQSTSFLLSLAFIGLFVSICFVHSAHARVTSAKFTRLRVTSASEDGVRSRGSKIAPVCIVIACCTWLHTATRERIKFFLLFFASLIAQWMQRQWNRKWFVYVWTVDRQSVTHQSSCSQSCIVILLLFHPIDKSIVRVRWPIESCRLALFSWKWRRDAFSVEMTELRGRREEEAS